MILFINQSYSYLVHGRSCTLKIFILVLVISTLLVHFSSYTFKMFVFVHLFLKRVNFDLYLQNFNTNSIHHGNILTLNHSYILRNILKV